MSKEQRARQQEQFEVEWEELKVRVNKPCKELNYCPYGVLVWTFLERNGDQACGVYGYECPVFKVARPYVDNGQGC